MRFRAYKTALFFAVLTLIISGCNGGGSASDAGTPAPTKMVTGVAATGAPVVGAVTLKDSSPVSVELRTSTAVDGSFSFNTTDLTAPFILRSSSGGNAIYSLAIDSGITNITPLTTIVLSMANGGADLETMYAKPNLADIKAAAAKMPDAVFALQSTLDPLLKQYSVSGNILNAPFIANHTGVDALLDAINVTISAGTVTISSKVSAAVIFSAPCTNISAGTVVLTNIQVPAPPPAQLDGAALYDANCSGCHGSLGSSSKSGITTVRLQNAISGKVGGMGSLSSLTTAEQQAIVTALNPTTTTPTPTPTPTLDGVALYGSSCTGCHGALTSSSKAGATTSRIQTAINGNVGGMGFLSSLNSAQVTAIASALATVTAPSTPTPTPACGSCHAIPPLTGQHSRHLSKNVSCATCHGSGYSTTSFNAATHNNGAKNVAGTIGWNATSRSCSNSCHGTERW